jgi:hypothetical protein
LTLPPQSEKALRKGGAFFVFAIMAAVMQARNGAAFMAKRDAGAITAKRMGTRLRNYAESALTLYIQAAKDEAEVTRQGFSTLVRSPEFFFGVRDRILRNYRQLALSTKWLDDALPKIG